MRLKLGGTASILLLVFTSCTYTLKDEYINPVLPPEPLNLVVEINDPNFTDPYLLDWPTTFELKFTTTKPILESNVFLDGALYPSTYSNQLLRFNLSPLNMNVGTHTVKIEMKFRTLSGSLVDQLAGEYYLVEEEFQVVTTNTIPLPINPLIASMENGYMILRWDMGSGRSYRYTLAKYKVVNGASFFIEQDDFFGAKKMYVDSGFVGGTINYVLNISNAFGSSQIGSITKRVKPAEFEITYDENNVGSLIWKNPATTANITLSGPKGSETVSLNVGKILLDTFFLGDQKNYRVFVHRNTFPLQMYDSIFTVQKAPSNLIPFKNQLILPEASKLILLDQYKLSRYSLPEFSKEEELYSVYGFSQQMVASSDESNLVVGNTRFNPLKLSEFSGINPTLKQPDGNYQYFPFQSLSSLSNTGLIAANFMYNGSHKAGVHNLAMNTALDVIEWSEDLNDDTPLISDDGLYLVVNNSEQTIGRVYKKIAGTWTLIGNVPPNKKYWRGHSTTELIIIGTSVQVFDVTTLPDENGFFVPLRSHSFINTSVIDIGYDQPSQNIYVQSLSSDYYSTIKIYSINNFILTGRAKAYLPPVAPVPTRHIYSNNFHFLTNGYGEKLKP